MSAKHRLKKLEDKTGAISLDRVHKEAARMTDYERADYINTLTDSTLLAIVGQGLGIKPEEITDEILEAVARGEYNP